MDNTPPIWSNSDWQLQRPLTPTVQGSFAYPHTCPTNEGSDATAANRSNLRHSALSPGLNPSPAKRAPAGSRGRLASVPFRHGGKARGWQLLSRLAHGYGSGTTRHDPSDGRHVTQAAIPGIQPRTRRLQARVPLRRGTGKRHG